MDKRYLAIDFGTVRIGIAISDPLGLTAQAKPYLLNNANTLNELKQYIDTFAITDLVVGMPFHTKGGLTKKSTEVKAFVTQLSTIFEGPIHYIDERFSSVAAQKQLSQLGLNQKKQRQLIDSQAAAFFLQGVLDKIRFKKEKN